MSKETSVELKKEILAANKKIDSLNTQIGKLYERLDATCHEVDKFKGAVEKDIRNIVKFLKEGK